MPLQQLLRDLVGIVSNRPSTVNASANSLAAGPRPAEVSSRQAAATEDAGSQSDPHSSQTSGSDDLTLAQGQELLGPCRDCNGYWTRELARGQKPLSCPVCKRLGPPT